MVAMFKAVLFIGTAEDIKGWMEVHEA